MMTDALKKKKQRIDEYEEEFNDLSNQLKEFQENGEMLKYETNQKSEEIQDLAFKLESLTLKNSDGDKELFETKIFYEKTVK